MEQQQGGGRGEEENNQRRRMKGPMQSDNNHHHQQQQQQQQQQPQQPQKCPRCQSPNTKFCYYNNYSLSQPRYFCKACRRYWTQGGTLRNVPVGGGCRKGKRSKSSSSSGASSSSGGTGSQPPPPHIPNLTNMGLGSMMISGNGGGTLGLLPNTNSYYPGGVGGGAGPVGGGGGYLSSLAAMQTLNHPPMAGGYNGQPLRQFPAPTHHSNLALLQGFGLPSQPFRGQGENNNYQFGNMGATNTNLMIQPPQNNRPAPPPPVIGGGGGNPWTQGFINGNGSFWNMGSGSSTTSGSTSAVGSSSLNLNPNQIWPDESDDLPSYTPPP